MAASDTFQANAAGLTSPLQSFEAVTPHDTNEQTFVSRAVYVGVAGNITFMPANGGSAILIKNVPVGWHPIRAKRINSTGTTATDMVFGQ